MHYAYVSYRGCYASAKYARTDKRNQLIGDQTTFSCVFTVLLYSSENLPYFYICGLSDLMAVNMSC